MICDDHFPVQVLKVDPEDSDRYSIGELQETGEYLSLPGYLEMAWTDGKHINAVSQWTSPTDEHFAFASVDKVLCRINANGSDCFPNGTLVVKANAGAIVGLSLIHI